MKVELCAIDIETKDPHLKTKGVGCRRGDGYIMGVAIGWKWQDGSIDSRYFNLRHDGEDGAEELPLMDALREIKRNRTPITGANLIYDFDWIAEELGITFDECVWEDVQVAEPLIDENARYSLGKIAEKYLGESKSEDLLYQYCARKFGGKATRGVQAKNIWRCPYSIVEPYALSDVELPLRIHPLQMKQIEEQELGSIHEIECQLQPVLLGMKRRGVRVDVDKAVRMMEEFAALQSQCEEQLFKLNRSVPVEVWSAASIQVLFDRMGEGYPLTPKTKKPSFTKDFLMGHRKEWVQLIVKARHYDKLRGAFLENAVLGSEINGRIHCQFNQLRGDEYGTITGRLSSSLPNLQQVPTRTEDGKRIRSCFIPDEGQQWGKGDYSQIEPRLLLSYAPVRMVKALLDRYAADPSLSCYLALQERMPGLSYTNVKAIYLGATYGMGKDTMALNMGCSVEEAEPQFVAFHEGAPYIRKTSNLCMRRAEIHGQIRTIGGRVSRFPLWEPAKFTRGAVGLPREDAEREYGPRLKRAYLYKALNRLIQGGAADIMKRAMVVCHQEGLFNENRLGFPLLTVHDELDVSYHDPRDLHEMGQIMEGVYSDLLKVRMRVDLETGPTWGEVVKL